LSNSYKKSPVCTDHFSPASCWAKRQAAKAVRRYYGCISKGSSYKKVYCSWNICDYRFYQPKEQAIKEWENNKRLQARFTKENLIRNWENAYRRK
jgi:hypothetical protein